MIKFREIKVTILLKEVVEMIQFQDQEFVFQEILEHMVRIWDCYVIR